MLAHTPQPKPPGFHSYLADPYCRGAPWLSKVETRDYRAIPRAIRELEVECDSFSGLFPEINRAWIVVDNKLFLWLRRGHRERS